MENSTPEPKTRLLIITSNKPAKPVITESDLSVAYLGGMVVGGILVGFTVAGIMSDRHDREQVRLREESRRLRISGDTLERDLRAALINANRLIAKAERKMDEVDNVTPLRP